MKGGGGDSKIIGKCKGGRIVRVGFSGEVENGGIVYGPEKGVIGEDEKERGEGAALLHPPVDGDEDRSVGGHNRGNKDISKEEGDNGDKPVGKADRGEDS